MSLIKRISILAQISFVVLGIVVFLSALLWAKHRDPFRRIHLSVETPVGSVAAVVFLPKPVSTHPVVFFLNDSQQDGWSGLRLRQIAEMGVAAVGVEYTKEHQDRFDEEFAAVVDHILGESWARADAIAWFGYGLGAERLLGHAVRQDAHNPDILISLAGGLRLDSSLIDLSSFPGCRYLFIHGENDSVYPVRATDDLALSLRNEGIEAKTLLLEGKSVHFGRDQDIVFRAIAEYVHSFFELSFEADYRDGSWRYWIPTALLGTSIFAVGAIRVGRMCFGSGRVTRRVVMFYGIAAVVTTAALVQTGIHLGLPYFSISERTVNLARHLVRAEFREDFDFIVERGITAGTPIRQVLQHVELANLQRNRFYPELPEEIFRPYILSPQVFEGGVEGWGWRRVLWETFYPRVRKADTPAEAAEIVVRFLRERVGINESVRQGHAIETCWRTGWTSDSGFDGIYVAAMRSVGIAARIGESGAAELWTGHSWVAAPQPYLRHGFSRGDEGSGRIRIRLPGVERMSGRSETGTR